MIQWGRDQMIAEMWRASYREKRTESFNGAEIR
jgi:hypothetical protein